MLYVHIVYNYEYIQYISLVHVHVCHYLLNQLVFFQGESITKEKLQALVKLIEPFFLFSLVWSIGATCDGPSRQKFSVYLREKCKTENISMPFPEDGLVYDYKLDDGGISRPPKGDEEDEEDKKSKKRVRI